MPRHKKKDGVPDRWLDYKAVGKRLHGTRFIAFKVPLKQSFNSRLPRPEVFGHWELLDAVRKQNQQLGLIIDLTFTKRYYSLQDVPDSLLCVKILTKGHEVPSDAAILSFKRAVRRFLQDNVDNDLLIGVHCTHGLNRTGYLICRYLIDVDGMDPQQAVELFNSSRGHAIERQNYLRDLQRGPRRSNEGMEESEQEQQRGRAARPLLDSDGTWNHRSAPPPGVNHPSQVLLPAPPLPPPPPFCHPIGAPLYPYRWPPPRADSQWRRPPRSEESRSRYHPAEWSYPPRWQQDRRRGPPPPRPPPMRHYSPHWTDESNVGPEQEEWAAAKERRYSRHPR